MFRRHKFKFLATVLALGSVVALPVLPVLQATRSAHAFPPPQSAPPSTSYIQADSDTQGVGIEGWYMSGSASSVTLLPVVTNTELRGQLTLTYPQGGFTARAKIDATGDEVFLDATDPSHALVHHNGQFVAEWFEVSEDEYELIGFENLGDSAAHALLVNTLYDSKLRATSLPGNNVAAGPWVIPPILLIPIGIGVLIWCVGQCQCCEAFWLGPPQPPPGSTEPSCCGNCNSPRCLSFNNP